MVIAPVIPDNTASCFTLKPATAPQLDNTSTMARHADNPQAAMRKKTALPWELLLELADSTRPHARTLYES
jgi:hypothetical protein